MSQPLEKIREDVSARTQRRPIARFNTPAAVHVLSVATPRADGLVDAQRAVRSKAWFLAHKRCLDVTVAILRRFFCRRCCF